MPSSVVSISSSELSEISSSDPNIQGVDLSGVRGEEVDIAAKPVSAAAVVASGLVSAAVSGVPAVEQAGVEEVSRLPPRHLGVTTTIEQ